MSDQLLSLPEKTESKSDPEGTDKIKSGNMTGRNLILILISAMMLLSCSGKEEKPDRTGLIPEKELIPILTEIHIADGLMLNPRIKDWVLSVDSISTYYYIIEKHGYTKELFDKTMHYYFVRKPKQLIRIYDGILAKLSEMESLLEKEVKLERDHASNLWPGERYYYFPDTSGTESVGFELSLTGSLFYTLRFTVTIFPDDQSVNPRASIVAYDADSVLTGKPQNFETLKFLKDGHPNTYSIRLRAISGKTLKVKGSLYETDNHPEEWQKHVRFDNITFTTPSAEL
ncbi:MAG: hypothetical protein A2X05_14005 [Bacteroidetes bacterium GWE2_41_25]|nr:MAG: hypothetical protein A2X03_12775 [Bacteroidetes bacterium GWA2_40_15]OFX91292.1 MAG: hypothetical protein A2X05_14005 [Bacteroidetes bacterium GWE2_41_25]OFX95537.1 MAG: hypothetical protein A2X06_12840 [Bacteroidetes bacterium GWC2_40_22]OFY61775.1 MAG: hypothetical protein A2X04_14155 [Bacteroidetes bacterium GWF2_41_9]HAM08899.1 hypothetical protein [Bacteroidales bacterium]